LKQPAARLKVPAAHQGADAAGSAAHRHWLTMTLMPPAATTRVLPDHEADTAAHTIAALPDQDADVAASPPAATARLQHAGDHTDSASQPRRCRWHGRRRSTRCSPPLTRSPPHLDSA
jgi:hypothetical protein